MGTGHGNEWGIFCFLSVYRNLVVFYHFYQKQKYSSRSLDCFYLLFRLHLF